MPYCFLIVLNCCYFHCFILFTVHVATLYLLFVKSTTPIFMYIFPCIYNNFWQVHRRSKMFHRNSNRVFNNFYQHRPCKFCIVVVQTLYRADGSKYTLFLRTHWLFMSVILCCSINNILLTHPLPACLTYVSIVAIDKDEA